MDAEAEAGRPEDYLEHHSNEKTMHILGLAY